MSEIFKEVWDRWEQQFKEVSDKACPAPAEEKPSGFSKNIENMVSALEVKEERIKALDDTVSELKLRLCERQVMAQFNNDSITGSDYERRDLKSLVRSYESTLDEKEKTIARLYSRISEIEKANRELQSQLKHFRLKAAISRQMEPEKISSVTGWFRKPLLKVG